MRRTARTVAIAGISAVALLATACGGDSDDTTATDGNETTAAEGAAGGEIVVDGCTPENPLVAGNTSETCGGDVLEMITARLVNYNADDASPENDIAESIETEDNQTFTVKIKQGYMFQDGTEVKAQNFVDAWNYTAFGPNGQTGSYFMSPIEGFAEVNAEGSTVEELSGLEVVDDYTFTIRTSEPVSNLPVRLGYTAFAPQPDAFFEDPESFGKAPIGAGPYQVTEYNDGQSIVVEKFADYSGDFGGQVDKITFRIYQDQDAAYNDLLAGQIDVIRTIPQSALIDDKYQSDLGDRNTQRETGRFNYVGINTVVSTDLADPAIRKAISMAIDRETINEQIFNNSYTPATGWVSPVVDGYQENACGEFCTYDPEAAKAMLDEAGGYDGELTLSYNGDGDHKAWTEATCNSISQALDISCTATPVVDFATFLTQLGNGEMTGMWRLGWVMDYPSIENFLAPIYAEGADSNYFGPYVNEEFESLLTQAAAAPSLDEANALYQQAELLLAEDMVAIPMYYPKTTIGWSEKVNPVTITAFGRPDLASVTLAQ
ncbi:ABC transporter substrate-binding protein [Nostocoides sp. F2B08]|uniref:peptide ABC transporter substrate-binding protein n=1 Tax=Nostocoides sp. F2B08 TaxID=2653936 RepID=UPI001263C0D9|nr:ABC transporter substrate-binding protein [Tetrasphaera sp. F2B08]KAB7746196.1 ABC transporter substrate-binding protein [Tetrasphaera sp. F2B08]